MPTLLLEACLDYEPKSTPGTLYYECKRCGRRTKTYRKIKRHLRSCRTSLAWTRVARFACGQLACLCYAV
jgi:ribosomal protein S14